MNLVTPFCITLQDDMKQKITSALCAAFAVSLSAFTASAASQDSSAQVNAAYEAQLDAYMAELQTWTAAQSAYEYWSRLRRGWQTTPSGLQYHRVGKANPQGAQPTATDNVTVHYRGQFIDGREFDSSYSRNEPSSFPLNRVIAGWTEGVALMREGETYEFVIPSELAYGNRWVGGSMIPPGSTLLFTVELITVNP